MKYIFTFIILLTSFLAQAQSFQLNLEDSGFKLEDIPMLTCIIQYESGFNPKAYYKSNYGLTQINKVNLKFCNLKSTSELYDPYTNLRCALKLRNDYGWKPWSTYPKCKKELKY